MEKDAAILPGVDENEFKSSVIVLAQTKDGVSKQMTAKEFVESDAVLLKVIRRGKTGEFAKMMEAAMKRLMQECQK